MLTVSTRTIGKRRPLLDDFGVPPPEGLEEGDGGIELRDLIEHIVRQQHAAFREREEARRFDRVLSARQIERDAAKGKVAPGASQNIEARRELDEAGRKSGGPGGDEGAGPDGDRDETEAWDEAEEAVAVALQAFEDGLYLVVIDGEERRSLDEPVYLRDDSTLVFVKLTFLAGM